MFIKGSTGITKYSKSHIYEEGCILPVLSADELLFGSRHKGLIRQFRDLAEMPDQQFYSLYGQLINHFLEFVQILPHKPNGVLGSMINYALARTSIIFQKYCQIRKLETTPLLKYAVFSAALLKDVGKVLSQQRVILVDEEGEYISDWNPLQGSMVGQASYYKIYQISKAYLRIESEVTPLLARQLLSKETFLWISSDLSVFSDWLGALLGEEAVGSKEISWALQFFNLEDFMTILSTLDNSNINGKLSVTTEYAERFLQWLKEAIESGKLSINGENANLHMLPQGIFIDQKLFKEFAESTSASVEWKVIAEQFDRMMGIRKKSGEEFLDKQYVISGEASTKTTTFSTRLSYQPHAIHHGLVLGEPALLIMHAQIPAISHLMRELQPKIPKNHQEPPLIASENTTSMQYINRPDQKKT